MDGGLCSPRQDKEKRTPDMLILGSRGRQEARSSRSDPIRSDLDCRRRPGPIILAAAPRFLLARCQTARFNTFELLI